MMSRYYRMLFPIAYVGNVVIDGKGDDKGVEEEKAVNCFFWMVLWF